MMMQPEHNLFYFYKNAIQRDLCGEYKKLWKQCKDDKQKLMNLALMQQSLPYFVSAIAEGFGLSIGYLKKEFADFINGNYVAHDVDGVEGYTSSMWVDYNDDKTVTEDVTAYIQCEGDVTIEESKCPTIYVANNSDINVLLEGFNSARFYVFDKSHIHFDYIPTNANVTVFRYSDDAMVTAVENEGKLKIFKKDLRL